MAFPAAPVGVVVERRARIHVARAPGARALYWRLDPVAPAFVGDTLAMERAACRSKQGPFQPLAPLGIAEADIVHVQFRFAPREAGLFAQHWWLSAQPEAAERSARRHDRADR